MKENHKGIVLWVVVSYFFLSFDFLFLSLLPRCGS